LKKIHKNFFEHQNEMIKKKAKSFFGTRKHLIKELSRVLASKESHEQSTNL